MENDKHNSYEVFKKLTTEELKNLLSEGMLAPDAANTVSDILRQRHLTEIEKKKPAITFPNSASRASLASRLGAKMIDVWGLFLILVLLISVLQDALPGLREGIGYVGIGLGLAYFLLKDGMKGQSIGKRLCGIAVVHVGNETPCSWGASVVRNLIGFFGIFDLVFLFGSDRRRLGDLAAGTRVIKSTYLA